MTSAKQLQDASAAIRFDAQIMAALDPRIFDPAWLRAEGLWRGSTQGRSQAHFFEYAGREMVLRHFHRGGLVGRVNRDLFMRTSPGNSRGFLEFDLLAMMHAKGLPVPRPVAARFVPVGPFYRADLVTQRIAAARPLAELLQAAPLPPEVWARIGACVKTFHAQRIFHSDLNARNILLDADHRPWVIDFDKCRERAAGPWMQGNLDRLKRSLVKTRAQTPSLSWGPQEWEALLAGYEAGDDGGAPARSEP